MYKVHRGISPKIFNDLFPLRQADQYNLRNRLQFIIPNVKTVNYGSESLKYLGPKVYVYIYIYIYIYTHTCISLCIYLLVSSEW